MKSARICIVEDEYIIGRQVQLMLEDLGYHAEDPIARGEEVLARLDRQPCDLVLMDIRLAGRLNGIQTAEQIHQRHGTPIIFLTAHGDQKNIVAAKTAQPYAFLIKPCSAKDLLAAVEIALMRNEAAKADQAARKIWEATFDAVPDLVFAVDNNTVIQRINKAMARRLGRRPEEIIGRRCYEVMHSPAVQPDNCPLCSAMQKQNECRTERWEEKLNGYFIMTFSPIHDEEGNIVGWVHVYRDITARRRIEQERELLLAELESAMSEVKTLSGLLPICASCKNIRDDSGYWNKIEEYLTHHTEATFSHGICPDCVQRLYSNIDLQKTK